MLDKALVVTVRGVIGKNSAKITLGRDAIGPEFAYASHGDGVYKDGSLVQHSNIAYTAGYGAVWLSRAADMTYLLNGSPWPVTDPNVNNVYRWVTDTFEPVIYKGLYMDMVNGRGISREGSGSARGTIVTLLRLAEGALSRRRRLHQKHGQGMDQQRHDVCRLLRRFARLRLDPCEAADERCGGSAARRTGQKPGVCYVWTASRICGRGTGSG